MRYYQIIISVPQGMSGAGNILIPNKGGRPGFTPVEPAGGIWSYCSLNNGANINTVAGANAAAQQVDIDIPTAALHTPKGNAYVRIWGVSLAEIAQASNLNHLNIDVYGGMSAGLPLANPAQAGVLAQGQILRASGDWVGTSQYLGIYIAALGSSTSSAQTTGNPPNASTTPVPATNVTPCNLTFQWKPGQPLMPVLAQALSTAFPQYNIQGAVSPNLVWTGSASTGFFANLEQFAHFIQQKTLSLLQGWAPNNLAYNGVWICLKGRTITITDGSTQTPPKKINFQDLVGQPSWNGPASVQVCTVMRGDIDPGDYVTLPETIFSTGQASSSQSAGIYNGLKLSSVFQGSFLVKGVRHVGNSRGTAMQDWITVLDLIAGGTPATATVNSYPTYYKGST
jgi:hypothetical protein